MCWRIVLVATWLMMARAHAEPAQLTAARSAYDAQDQDRTIALLTPLLAGALAAHDRAAAERLAGCAYMVLGDRAAAIAAFQRSFALEPDAALESPLIASPDARSLFEEANGLWRAALVTEMETHAAELKRLQLEVTAPPRARGGRPLAIAIRVADPGRLAARVELSFRRRGQGTFTLLTERLTTPPVFSIPAEATESATPFVLEYHVTVRHQTGFPLRRAGDPDHPRTISIAAGHRPRWHESNLVRGALVLGLVGLATGGYFVYRSIDVGPQRVVVGGGE
ncbi:MAG: hypothetical protein ABI867_04225 [Kofleriaceae bacterium]